MIPASNYESSSGVTARITGSPVIEFQRGFESVTIINHTDKDLEIDDISTVNSTGQFNQNVIINVADQSAFSYTVTTSNGNTPLSIENTGSDGDILLNGVIDNPFGVTEIVVANGDLESLSAQGLKSGLINAYLFDGRL